MSLGAGIGENKPRRSAGSGWPRRRDRGTRTCRYGARFRRTNRRIASITGTSPDIAVTDGVLIVATSHPAKAAALCRSVAADTNDPDTAAPLGVKRVVIISGGQQIADCGRY